MRFFDCNATLGRLAVPLPGYFESAEAMVRAITRAGVDEALVHQALAKEYDPETGNRKLLEEIEGFPNLHPSFCVLPHHTGETPAGPGLVAGLQAAGVRATRAFPRSQNWSLAEWSAGVLLTALEEASIPLFLDFAETSCDEAYALCERHPGLPVVLCGAPFRLSRLVYALLAETTNLRLDTSSFQLFAGIEDVCARFGAERLLFGTAAPHFDPAPSVMAVRYAGVSEEEKTMIAGENLRKLLGLTS